MMAAPPNDPAQVIDLDAAQHLAPVVVPDDVAEAAPPETSLPPHATLQEDGCVALPLLYPVTLPVARAGRTERVEHAALTLRRLKGADKKRAASRAAEDQLVFLAALSAGLHPAEMNALYENMDAVDCIALEQVMGHFLGLGPKTGR